MMSKYPYHHLTGLKNKHNTIIIVTTGCFSPRGPLINGTHDTTQDAQCNSYWDDHDMVRYICTAQSMKQNSLFYGATEEMKLLIKQSDMQGLNIIAHVCTYVCIH